MAFGYFYNFLRSITNLKIRRLLKRQSWFVTVSSLLFGNSIYCKSYYDEVEQLEGKSVEYIANWINKYFYPKKIVDIGCGPGHLMAALERKKISVYGVDVSAESIRRVKNKGYAVDQFDLTQANKYIKGAPYDIAISCEVAEHLDGKYADTFVDILTHAAPFVYLTATEPSPKGVGLHHVNEQKNDYWIRLMEEHGYELDRTATEDARKTLDTQEVVKYLKKPMIFHKKNSISDRK